MKSNLGGLLSKIIHSDENIIHSNISKTLEASRFRKLDFSSKFKKQDTLQNKRVTFDR